ncbi:hypothetical protein COW94_01785 [Candidatus Peregrinibacteria bacterium CG22_combo_CG10-13_8_21_14_all_44_10]|nr:MAG: hypothetical protein AUK45_03465 [Candidatus Peregrinibacteria bacterium CG2_30_44_17]PIP66448.1 MAG: hypothetical protein COW94_01785 [Candidatus Peregrinibacteria bacterium CG22_combo_CG10-13_8_21_14_all_44_10]PJB88795.1 MAG: hypothetical protein CO082_03285 [Candidatus Peregrinibacteria bacterium CG_4_9_14_0_8_um_filter_44_15]
MISWRASHIQRVVLIAGVLTLLLSLLSLKFDTSLLNISRVGVGMFFVLTMGLPYLRILKRKSDLLTGVDGAFGVALSLLMTYPTGVLNIFIEGKQYIYREHLTGFILIALMLFIIGIGLSRAMKVREQHIKINKQEIRGVSLFLLVGFLLRVANLGGASINGDEMDLSVQSYDLVDGMVAGRNAYFISETGHSPLGFFISHAIYNLFEPRGFYEMSLWMIRIPQVIMGLLVIVATFIAGKKLLKEGKAYLALVPAAIVAIDSYSNFASRLAIFQDMSTYTFFVITFVLLAYEFVQERTWDRALRMGVGLGLILITKLAGLFLIPMLAGLILLYQKDWKKPLGALAVAFGVFIPVMFYNIAAYITTGYMDVPMAKLANMIGIPAKSLMNITENTTLYEGGIRNPLLTLIEMPFMLIDQWGLGLSSFFIAISITGVVVFLRYKQGREALGVLYVVLILSIIFFSLNGFRVYYLPYLTVIMSLMGMLVISKTTKPKQILLIVGLIVVPFTLIYNINTNILLKEGAQIEQGRSGDGEELIITYHSQMNQPYSISASAFLSDQGWDELIEVISQNGISNLILDDNINPLSEKWYLHINDQIREFYADPNYQEKYNYTYLSDWDGEVSPGTMLIAIEPIENSADHDEIIIDRHGNTEFYVYWTQ